MKWFLHLISPQFWILDYPSSEAYCVILKAWKINAHSRNLTWSKKKELIYVFPKINSSYAETEIADSVMTIFRLQTRPQQILL